MTSAKVLVIPNIRNLGLPGWNTDFFAMGAYPNRTEALADAKKHGMSELNVIDVAIEVVTGGHGKV